MRGLTPNLRFEAFDLLSNPVWVFDPSGELCWANAAAVALSGAASTSELLNRSTKQIFLKGPSRLLFLGLEIDSGYRERQRWVLVSPAGPVLVDCDCSSVAFESGETGLLAEGRVAVSDRADLIATQHALAEAKRLLAAVLDNSPVGLAIADAEYRIRFVNKSFCEIFAGRADLLTGRALADLFLSESDWRRVAIEAETALSAGGTYYQEMPLLKRNGERIWCSLSARGLESEPDHGVIWGVVDVTQRIEDQVRLGEAHNQLAHQARELERSNAELESFAYVASHDLRQPLRQVHGYLSLIERASKDALNADALEFMAFAKAGAQRMDRLIQDLLDYARIGRAKRQPVTVDLGEVMAEAIQILDAAVTETNGAIETDLGGFKVLGYGPDLVRLFQNLIGNALKYHAKDRTPLVRVGARQDDGGVVVSVADNGIGIDPAQFDRIFAIFQRLHGRDEYDGTGIGLAICRKIVDQQQGRIWVESRPGAGSTFFVRLPASNG